MLLKPEHWIQHEQQVAGLQMSLPSPCPLMRVFCMETPMAGVLTSQSKAMCQPITVGSLPLCKDLFRNHKADAVP